MTVLLIIQAVTILSLGVAVFAQNLLMKDLKQVVITSLAIQGELATELEEEKLARELVEGRLEDLGVSI